VPKYSRITKRLLRAPDWAADRRVERQGFAPAPSRLIVASPLCLTEPAAASTQAPRPGEPIRPCDSSCLRRILARLLFGRNRPPRDLCGPLKGDGALLSTSILDKRNWPRASGGFPFEPSVVVIAHVHVSRTSSRHFLLARQNAAEPPEHHRTRLRFVMLKQ